MELKSKLEKFNLRNIISEKEECIHLPVLL
jgi:hypothetical protein